MSNTDWAQITIDSTALEPRCSEDSPIGVDSGQRVFFAFGTGVTGATVVYEDNLFEGASPWTIQNGDCVRKVTAANGGPYSFSVIPAKGEQQGAIKGWIRVGGK